ncbi:MAG: HAD hydrolase-like protein [Candidatus Jorgensenbacteria bacterium]|nr:HAD hydrolase-like protein [Candidatus Jorgensenbacteria bacterium]
MEKKFILFDFDGVIADSFQPAFETQKIICPHLTEDIYRKRFEGNINDWEEPINIHTEECRHDIDFFTEYIPRMKNEVQIVPGMKEVITEFEKNYTLIVISSTITSPIQEFLEGHDLANHFAQIMGNDVHKSKVEKMKMVFEKYGVEAKNCVFITDTLGDMHEAEKMKVGVIGITWGFHTPETLLRGKPFCLVEKPNNLLTAVADYFNVLK